MNDRSEEGRRDVVGMDAVLRALIQLLQNQRILLAATFDMAAEAREETGANAALRRRLRETDITLELVLTEIGLGEG